MSYEQETVDSGLARSPRSQERQDQVDSKGDSREDQELRQSKTDSTGLAGTRIDGPHRTQKARKNLLLQS